MQVRFLRELRPGGASQHQPLLAVSALTQLVCRLDLKGPVYADLIGTLEKYMQSCGICERIARTPMPMPYSRCAHSAQT